MAAKTRRYIMKITFKTGEVFEAQAPLSVYDAARELGIISREVIAAKVNGNACELSTQLTADAEVIGKISRAYVAYASGTKVAGSVFIDNYRFVKLAAYDSEVSE